MWNCFKSSSADEETVNNAFYTTELFKITSDEQVCLCIINVLFLQLLDTLFIY